MFSKLRENVESNFDQRQRQHVHCVEGNVNPAGKGRCRHTHCFETITGEAIPFGNSHVHPVEYVTSIEDCHCHKFCGRTGPAIPTGFGQHIHLIECPTSYNDGHRHCVLIATGTEQPVRC